MGCILSNSTAIQGKYRYMLKEPMNLILQSFGWLAYFLFTSATRQNEETKCLCQSCLVLVWLSQWLGQWRAHAPNSTIERCLNETGGPHIAWGLVTIGMSWVPAVFSFIVIVGSEQESYWKERGIPGSYWKKRWIPVRFILWPILVPMHM